MKKLAIAVSILLTFATAGTALAVSKLPVSYRAVYCYPGGSYWQKQIAAYPDYYKANKSYYVHAFGAATQYCPTH